MPEYSGSALYISYIHSAGTVALGTNYRTCSDNPDVEMIEITAGSDADKSYVVGPKSGNVSVTFLDETAAGTATYNALGTGTYGTLIIRQPETDYPGHLPGRADLAFLQRRNRSDGGIPVQRSSGQCSQLTSSCPAGGN